MDILGLPKIQNVERKLESKSQETSFSLQKNPDSVKSSPNSFSKQLEKSLDKNNQKLETEPKDKVTVSKTNADAQNKNNGVETKTPVKKQEYSRNEKINPPRDDSEKNQNEEKVLDFNPANMGLNQKPQSMIVQNKVEVKVDENGENSTGAANKLNLDQIRAGIVMSKDAQPNGIPESKLLNPKLESKVSADVLPILKFMKQMATDFKISPERIMQALNELPENALIQKPQAAVTHLLQKLEIQPREFTKAQILFNKMIDGIEKVETQNKESIIQEDGSLKLSSKMDVSRIDGKVENLKELKNLTQEIQNQIPQVAPKVGQQVTPTDISTLRTQNVMGVGPQASVGQKAEELSNLKNIVAQVTGSPQKGVSVEMKPTPSAMDIETLVSKMAIQRNEGQDKGDFAELEDEEEFTSEKFDKELIGKLSENGTDKGIQKIVDNILAKPNPEVQMKNIEKITEQTQILVQKGGGEMKVHLSPEGMGDVVLKVKVQDGQVEIQKTTDNQHAKKLLESSVTDLKLSLQDHKLNLETIKVDVAEKMQDQFLNQNSDFKREDAREFLGQFRQHNDNFRQSMFQMSGGSAYQKASTKTPEDIQPLQRSTSSSGRLHLVA